MEKLLFSKNSSTLVSLPLRVRITNNHNHALTVIRSIRYQDLEDCETDPIGFDLEGERKALIFADLLKSLF